MDGYESLGRARETEESDKEQMLGHAKSFGIPESILKPESEFLDGDLPTIPAENDAWRRASAHDRPAAISETASHDLGCGDKHCCSAPAAEHPF